MKRATLCTMVCAATLFACGGSTPPPAAPSAASSTKSDNPNRPLTEAECQSLGQQLAEQCQNRGNERSARVIGWCNDLVAGVQDGSWVTKDCVVHIKYMDSMCLSGANNIGAMMDCDRAVDRSQ